MSQGLRKIRLECSVEQAVEAAVAALNDAGFEVVRKDAGAGLVEGRKSASFFSWGEEASVRIGHETHGVSAEIKSDSLAQVIDWGTNEANVERIIQGIRKRSK